MKKRVYGIETEYRIVTLKNNQNYLKIINKNPNLCCQFAINGARIYSDRDLPEYASPECSSVLDLLCYEQAGDRIMFDMLKGEAHLLKSSRGWQHATSGCHENYLIDNALFTSQRKKFFQLILSFLVSRQILCGAGWISNDCNCYSLSQRSSLIQTISSLSTISSRAIINTRLEPWTDSRFMRFHLILGDANMSEISTFLKVGTTGIVLQMIEEGFLNNAPVLINPVRDIQNISLDLTCRSVVQLENRKRVTPINIQEWYATKAVDFFNHVSRPTPEEKLILKIWLNTLDKLRRNPMLLDQEIDWVIKKRWIENYQEKKGLPINHPQVRTFAYLYHHLDPEVGFYYRLLKQGKVKRLITDQMIEGARYIPPQDTRARLRGAVVKTLIEHPDYKNSVDLDWLTIAYYSSLTYNKIPIDLDPFTSKHEKIDWLIEQIKKGGNLIRKISYRP